MLPRLPFNNIVNSINDRCLPGSYGDFDSINRGQSRWRRYFRGRVVKRLRSRDEFMEREDYRTFLLRISEHITEEKLKQLKYLCSDDIPEGDLEKINSPLELFRDLERRKMIGIDDLSFLQKLLEDVTCFQLATKVDDFTSRREVELLYLEKQRRHVNCTGEVRKIEGAPMAGDRRNHFLNYGLREAAAVMTS